MANDLIRARLVYDGGDDVSIPPELGEPRSDQMQGTPAERLSELAGRTCHDSLGKGRPSFTTHDYHPEPPREPYTIQGYHDHILEVGHGSVLEHFNFTVEIPIGVSRTLKNNFQFADARQCLFAWQCANRPGVLSLGAVEPKSLRLTVNLRAVREWLPWSHEFYGRVSPLDVEIASMLHQHGNELAPHIIPPHPEMRGLAQGRIGSASLVEYDELWYSNLVAPCCDHERWISIFGSGSRGPSHEWVRHGDFTAISQRSTRFVDESESPWVEHPLETAYADAHRGESDEMDAILDAGSPVVDLARHHYRACVDSLEPWLISRGIDKTSARKQARGAARGYLGNALHTELVFSANVAQWKRMLRQRASKFADAEIRELFCKVLPELKRSRYGDRFDAFELQDSPDGIGQVAVEAQK